MTETIRFPKTLRRAADPAPQQIWGLPAALNFILGGTGVGYYLLWALPGRLPRSAFGALFAVLLVLSGFAALALEAGRPRRARYLLANWKRSWMSREAAAGLVFVLAASVDAFSGWAMARAVAAASGCALLVCQGMVVYACSAVPFWRDAAMPVVFVTSGLAGGYGMFVVTHLGPLLPRYAATGPIEGIVMASLLLNYGAWVAVLLRRRDRALVALVRSLQRPAKIAALMGMGQIIPVVLIVLADPGLMRGQGSAPALLITAAGLAVLAGSWAQKLWLTRSVQHVCALQLGND